MSTHDEVEEEFFYSEEEYEEYGEAFLCTGDFVDKVEYLYLTGLPIVGPNHLVNMLEEGLVQGKGLQFFCKAVLIKYEVHLDPEEESLKSLYNTFFPKTYEDWLYPDLYKKYKLFEFHKFHGRLDPAKVKYIKSIATPREIMLAGFK